MPGSNRWQEREKGSKEMNGGVNDPVLSPINNGESPPGGMRDSVCARVHALVHRYMTM